MSIQNMRGSTKRAFSILIAAIMLVVSFAVYVYLIKPSYQEISKKRGQLFTKQNQLKEYKSAVGQIQKLLAAYKDFAEIQKSVSQMIPTEPMIPHAMNQINGIASLSGLSLQSMTIKELSVSLGTSLVKGRGTLRINARLGGTYESMKAFLNNIESNVRIFNINSIKLDKAGSTPNVFSFNFEIDTFYQPQ